MEKFETTMSEKGQIIIVSKLRKEMGLKPNQKFLEIRKDDSILLKPVPTLTELGGILSGMETKSTEKVMKEIKEGWE